VAVAVIGSTDTPSNASPSTVVKTLVGSAMRARAQTVLARGERKKAVSVAGDLFLACRLLDMLNAGTWRRRLIILAINLPDVELTSAGLVHLREMGHSNRHRSLNQVLEWNVRMGSLYTTQSTVPRTRGVCLRVIVTSVGVLRKRVSSDRRG